MASKYKLYLRILIKLASQCIRFDFDLWLIYRKVYMLFIFIVFVLVLIYQYCYFYKELSLNINRNMSYIPTQEERIKVYTKLKDSNK